MAGVLTLVNPMNLGIKTYDVPYTQIVKIELRATVRAASPEEAVQKARNGDHEEVDEEDSEVLAVDINVEDVMESEDQDIEADADQLEGEMEL